MRKRLAVAVLSLPGLALFGSCGGGGAAGTAPAADPVPLVTWTRTVGGTAERWGRDAAGAPDGTAVVVGTFDDAATFGFGEPAETHLVSPAGWSTFIARYAADGGLAWARSIVGTEVYVQAVEVAPEGRTFVVGYFLGSADFGAGPDGDEVLDTPIGASETGFLALYESNGSLVWVRALAGAPWTEGLDVAIRPDGSAIVGGLFAGNLPLGQDASGEDVVLTAATFDGFVATYGADGRLQWARQVSAEGDGFATVWSVGAFPDGSVLVTGDYQGTAGVGGMTVTSIGDQPDVLYARLASDGTVAWVKSLGGPAKDKVYGACVAHDGSFALVGDHRSPIGFGERDGSPVALAHTEGTDAYIASFASDGTPLWARAVSGLGDQYLGDICMASDGALGVVGHMEVAAEFDDAASTRLEVGAGQGPDAFVATFDAAGALLTACALAGPGPDYGMGVAVAGDHGPLAVGVFEQSVSVMEHGDDVADLRCDPVVSTYVVQLAR